MFYNITAIMFNQFLANNIFKSLGTKVDRIFSWYDFYKKDKFQKNIYKRLSLSNTSTGFLVIDTVNWRIKLYIKLIEQH